MKNFLIIISASFVIFTFWIALSLYTFITKDDSQYFKVDPAFEQNKKISKELKNI
ncbi:MAG: hypothetical protein ABI543_05705 [Ignavibacteria bacterium]